MTLYCTIDRNPVPDERMSEKSIFKALTCSEECYASLRNLRRSLNPKKRVSAADYELLRTIRRSRVSREELTAMLPKRKPGRRARQSVNGAEITMPRSVGNGL